jgi:NAD(P) transhydrogenase subunit alpha
MRLAVVSEIGPNERRVALVPESCKKLISSGNTVAVERGAGEAAHRPDDAYREVGAEVVTDRESLLQSADWVLALRAPGDGNAGTRNDVSLLRQGALWLGTLVPSRHLSVVRALAARGVTAFATDLIPRTTKAQAMDTLSSMASIAGYKGALMAASELPKYLPMLTTAAGTIFPAKVLVIGAGVAGLQAIATARRLGASVYATDVRPGVKEEIESLGARFVGVELAQSQAGGGYAKALSEEDRKLQEQMLAEQVAQSDVVITTALIGGVLAPRLLSAQTVRTMQPGSVVVDLAADGGGNCELSKPGQTVLDSGVTIMAPLNVASTVPSHASLLYSRNLTAFVLAYSKQGEPDLDLDDEILRACTVTHRGEVRHAPTREALTKAAGA